MIFNTFAYYLLFLIPAAILYRCVRISQRGLICVIFGAGFYIYFSLTGLGGRPGAFCLAIFAWETFVSRFYKPKSWVCLLGIVQSILFLCVFKYWNFLTGNLPLDGPHNQFYWPGAFLPLGISFFTFEFIHYAADRYNDKVPAGRMRDYVAFIFFFPTMVAGPIKRYQYFLPAIQAPTKDWATDWQRGITRILCGSVKKFAVADVMRAFTNNLKYTPISQAHRWVLPLWLLAYGVQIYFDFSGYSDIAIGSARLFGMRVPENFDWPYLRRNISEFWRHWHISLYRWLVDYVFIPLGGSRVAKPRIYLNILITMLVSGIWHGAGLNFVVWGLWHGLLLCVHRLWGEIRGKIPLPQSKLEAVAAWAITFAAVTIGWAFFAMDIHTGEYFLKRLFVG
jgi:alginate O-acetyltransferase complex protein AlgI